MNLIISKYLKFSVWISSYVFLCFFFVQEFVCHIQGPGYKISSYMMLFPASNLIYLFSYWWAIKYCYWCIFIQLICENSSYLNISNIIIARKSRSDLSFINKVIAHFWKKYFKFFILIFCATISFVNIVEMHLLAE